jgi:thiamine biosynthesis lipoprotein
MGTVFSIDLRDEGDWTDALRDAVALLHRVDAVFSTYKPDSDLSRYRRGELALRDADPELATVLELCAEVQAETHGYFSARWRDGIDPTGLVKGWAIERASEVLRAAGSRNHAVNGGGDVQAVGEAAPGQPWRIAVVDPRDRSRICSVVSGRDIAVATSGTSERGEHIIDPFTGRPAVGLAAATVVGSSLTRVDAYATAAFVMGESALSWVESLDGYSGLVVTGDGEVRTTRRFPGVIGVQD